MGDKADKTSDKTEGNQVQTDPSAERQSPEGVDGVDTPDAGKRVEDRGTASGEGSDLRVDSPIVPDDKNDPRPTGA